jgi:hypothetical protein
VIELRASIIIGSGSLSFEMIRALVERLPVMVTPRWVRVTAQPIAVCASPSCNADAGCLAPAGYQTCVVQAGSHLCPAEYPKRSLAGVSGSVGACSPCSCSVSGATCSGALLYAYPNANCQGDAGLVVPVNGACVPSNNYVFQSLRYAATPSAQYVTTPGTPSVSFKSFVSICCR